MSDYFSRRPNVIQNNLVDTVDFKCENLEVYKNALFDKDVNITENLVVGETIYSKNLNIDTYMISELSVGCNITANGQYIQGNVPKVVIDSNGNINIDSIIGYRDASNNSLPLLQTIQTAAAVTDALNDFIKPVSDFFGTGTKAATDIAKGAGEALSDALSGGDDPTKSNLIYVDWNNLTRRPLANQTNDIAIKGDLAISEASSLFSAVVNGFSIDKTNLKYNPTGQRKVIDFSDSSFYGTKMDLSNIIVNKSGITRTSGSNNIRVDQVYFNSNVIIADTIELNDITSTSNLYVNTSCNLTVNAAAIGINSAGAIQLESQSNTLTLGSVGTLVIHDSNISSFTKEFNVYGSNSSLELKNNYVYTQNSSNYSVKNNITQSNFQIVFSSNNAASNTLNIDKSLNVTGICNLEIKKDLTNSVLYTSNGNLVITGDIIMKNGACLRTDFIQLSGGIPVNASQTPGLYTTNGRIALEGLSGQFRFQDSLDSLSLQSGILKSSRPPPNPGYQKSYTKSALLY